MIGIRFSDFVPNLSNGGSFEELLKIFLQLLTITAGDVAEALNWMNQIDQKYNLTDNSYGMGDFIQELKDKNYLQENEIDKTFNITLKTGQAIKKQSLEEIFWKLKEGFRGNHRTIYSGLGDE